MNRDYGADLRAVRAIFFLLGAVVIGQSPVTDDRSTLLRPNVENSQESRRFQPLSHYIVFRDHRFFAIFSVVMREFGGKTVLRKIGLGIATLMFAALIGVEFAPTNAFANKVDCSKVMSEVNAGKKAKDIASDLKISTSSVYRCKKKTGKTTGATTTSTSTASNHAPASGTSSGTTTKKP